MGSRGKTMALAGGVGVVASLGMALLSREHVPDLLVAAVVFLLGLSAMGWNALL